MERVSKSGKWEEGISQIQSRDEPCPEAGHDQRCIRIPTLGTGLSTKKKKRKKVLSRTPNLTKQNLWLCRERISIFNQLPSPFVCMLTFELRIWGWASRLQIYCWLCQQTYSDFTVSEFSKSSLLPYPLQRNYLT